MRRSHPHIADSPSSRRLQNVASLAFVVALGAIALGVTPSIANSAVVVGRDRIEVRKTIPFEAASAAVPPSSLPLLKELARALNANPQFTKVRIEGHTDSTGDTVRNRVLSEERANAVRAALIRFGVGEERLTARGFGASDPLQSNATELGRRQNRRVVFEVLQVGGKKVQRPPLAKVSARRNDVNSRAPLEESWRRAAVGDGLKRSWRVRTNLDSGAGITFRDASRIDMREETLVIIFGATQSTARKQPMRASLQTGALTAWLSDHDGKDAPLLVETPSGDGELTGGRVTVRTRGKRETRQSAFSNHAGKPARIFGKKKSGERIAGATKVDAGYGSRVKAGMRPDPPKKLPAPPKLTVATPIAIGVGGAKAVATGEWSPPAGASGLTLQMQSKDHPEQAPARVLVAGTTKSFRIENLPPGTYELQGSVVDDIGLESDPSPKQTIRAVQIGRVDEKNAANGDGRIRPGDAFVAPPGLRCAVDSVAFDDATALVARPDSRSIRCLLTEVVGTHPPSVAPLAIEPLPAINLVDPRIVAGEANALVLQSAGPLDETYRVDVIGAKLGAVDRNQDADGRREISVDVAPGTKSIEVQLLRRGVVMKSFSLATATDSRAPTISGVQVVRQPNAPRRIAVTATVVDDQSGVKAVTVGITGVQAGRTRMTREANTDHYAATLVAPLDGDSQSVTIGAQDLAGNGRQLDDNAVVHAIPPPPETLSPWWLAIPVGVAVPLILGGGLLSADAAQFQTTVDGPLVGRAVDNALGRTDDASTLALVEGGSGAALVVAGLTTLVVAGAAFILVASPVDSSAE